MKIVASTSCGPGDSGITKCEPDLIELRLDLMSGDRLAIASQWKNETDTPLVMTLRSRREGGLFPGTGEDWWKIIKPLLPFASYVDIEREFSSYAPEVREQGCTVVGSYHTMTMLSASGLGEIRNTLRMYGDIPKIVVSPGNYDQVLEFLAFTYHAEKPVITSIMGEQFRHVRAVLPLFGSSWIFGHAGTPTSAGQYSVGELRSLFAILEGKSGH
ncbi:MAG TPA: type I 3-dehydroquinate dehydratase [Methanoregulaceae archaeon]|nr:type I 3-dehydroquinate dehydratase [Methanoregulaceae archaeon]